MCGHNGRPSDTLRWIVIRRNWGAGFRIRKPARAWMREAQVNAIKRYIFFGLKILILHCVGLQIPRGRDRGRVYQNLREATAPPCRGSWPAGPEGFPMHVSNYSLFFRPVYVVRGCVRRCSRGPGTPSAPSRLVPLQGGTVFHDRPHGKQKGRNAPPHSKRNGHYGRRMVSRRALRPTQIY